MFDSDHSFSIDQCGNVDQISEHAAVLIPFYFLLIIILFGLIAKEIVSRVKTALNKRLVVAIVDYIQSFAIIAKHIIVNVCCKKKFSQEDCCM